MSPSSQVKYWALRVWGNFQPDAALTLCLRVSWLPLLWFTISKHLHTLCTLAIYLEILPQSNGLLATQMCWLTRFLEFKKFLRCLLRPQSSALRGEKKKVCPPNGKTRLVSIEKLSFININKGPSSKAEPMGSGWWHFLCRKASAKTNDSLGLWPRLCKVMSRTTFHTAVWNS